MYSAKRQAPPGKLCVRPVFDPGVFEERAGYRPGRAHQEHMGHDGRIQTRKTENQVPRSANPQVSQYAGGGISVPQPSKLVIMPPMLLAGETRGRA